MKNACSNNFTISNFRPVLTFFLFVARALISGAFQAAYVYTPEVIDVMFNNRDRIRLQPIYKLAATQENRSSGIRRRSDTNRHVQLQKMATSLKFRI